VVALVVAHSANRVIGKSGELPWHLPSDLRRFRELTSGHAVLMGRKTYESLPDAFRPLPNRRNLVISRNPDLAAPGAEVHPSLEAALDACGRDCFVIGGEAVYAAALPLADRLYVTHVEGDAEGDAFFPAIDDARWRRTERSEPLEEDGRRFTFATYDRA
jgi:dihydrofolate reductase